MATQKCLLLPEKYGAFEIGEVAIPIPAPGELLVEVRAASLNDIDSVVQKTGKFRNDYPAILGFDSAGVVKQVGEGVTSFAVGDRV